MCGIAGAVGYIDDSIQDAVRAMSGAQMHRGPDGEGYWSNVARNDSSPRGVVLAHRRLAILDLTSAGAQPMVDPSSGRVIAYNGEVYNFHALRHEMATDGEEFHSDCDTEVVLRLLARRGLSSLSQLNGMFAFACWDPATRRLQLARDRVGIKPLYLATVRGGNQEVTVLFASEVRALLASGLVPRQLDHAGLASYLWNGFVVGPATIVEGVRLLPAGSSVTIAAGQECPPPERYWQLPRAASGKADREQVTATLESAVKQRLVADVPLGVFLSGGIDSSAVAAIAARVGNGAVHTFNLRFAESEYDESQYARRIAQQLGTEHTSVELSDADFRAKLDEALACADQPTFDAINTYFVSRAVREAGIKVALAGTGGDELFGGYASYRELPLARRCSGMTKPVPTAMLRSAAGCLSRLLAGPGGALPPQTRWGKLADVLATRGELTDLYQVSYALYTEAFHQQLRPTNGCVRHGLPSETRDELRQLIDGDPTLHAISMLELSCFIGQRLLRDTDAASMAVSLEVRVPLLDHELIDVVSQLDLNERFLPLGRKQLLRDMALQQLDRRCFERPKAGFVLPIDTWLRASVAAQVEEAFRDEESCRRIGLNPQAVNALWNDFRNAARGVYWSRVWALYVLLRWCREHQVFLAEG